MPTIEWIQLRDSFAEKDDKQFFLKSYRLQRIKMEILGLKSINPKVEVKIRIFKEDIEEEEVF